MIIRNKFNGYSGDGRRLYPGGGGGPTTSYTQTSNIPEYAQPYVERMMGATEKQVYKYDPKGNITGFQPFQSYAEFDKARGGTGETVAGFTPMQAGAMKGLQEYQLPGQTAAASGMTADLAGRSLQAGQYQPGIFGNFYNAPSPYQAGRFGVRDVGVGTFTRPGTAEAYMSPYQQAVTDVEKRELARQSAIEGQRQQAQAVQAGAFGGSRQGLIEAERQRNLMQQMGDIQARGGQNAFQQAREQFNAENLQAGLQAQLANQQAYQQAQQAREQSRQFGYGQGMTSAQLAAQYGLEGQRATEQSRQFGAGLGMQGIEQARAAAGQLGSLGQQQYGQEMGLLGQRMDVGAKQQQYEQARLNQIIQDYATSQQYPFIQLGTLSNMLRGLPMQASTTQMYQAQPSFLQQGIGLAGAYSNLKQAGALKEGGEVKKMATGGIATGDPYKLPSMMKKLSDEQLSEKMGGDTDPETMGIAQAEKQRRDHIRKGMAGGGAVAFAKGGTDQVKNPMLDPDEPKTEEPKTEEPKKTAPARPKAAAPKPAENVGPYEAGLIQMMKQPSPIAADVAKLREAEAGYEKEAALGMEGQLKRIQEGFKKFGVDRAAIYDSERAENNRALEQAQGDARKAEHLRYAQMWAKFGSTPGPILKAGLLAIEDTIPDLIEDQKKASELQRNIRKSINDLNRAEYLESKGDIERAAELDRNAKDKAVTTTLAASKLIAGEHEARMKVVGGAAEKEIMARSAKETALINERSQIAGVALREKAEQRRYDEAVKKQAEIDKKRADLHTKNARAEIANFYKQNQVTLDGVNKVLSAPNVDEKAKEMANKELTRLRSEEMRLRRELAASYPDARQEELESPLSGAAPAPAMPGKIKFENPEAAKAFEQYK